MLWKKESANANALFVDIMGMGDKFIIDAIDVINYSKLGFPFFNKSTSVKNDGMSQEKRIQGNALFAKNYWIKAIELYNESLCLATERSKNIALAYANRAASFLAMRMYSECLIDIELAKAAGYPTEKMPKLDQRKANCLKEMEHSKLPSNRFVEQLSYEPNENFPSMANILNVTKDSAGKYSVIAMEDIDVGQTVAVEKVLFGCVYQHFGLKCNICLKSNTNLIACKKCTTALFCSAECQSSRLHEYECGIQPGHSAAGYRMMRDLRCLLVVINLFPSADALMKFIEQTRRSADLLPSTMKDKISQYFAYFKLRHCENDMGNDLAVCVAPIYKLAMSIAPIKEMFRAKKHERFLQHLIAHHLFITPESGRDLLNEYDQHSQVNVMMCYFDHSCAPNMISVPTNGKLMFITSRPIKKGEELFDSTKSQKRECCYADNHSAVCMSRLCTGIVKRSSSPEQRRRMTSDPNFKSIVAMGSPALWEAYGEEELQSIINKCVVFLKEYGRANWCDEIEKAMKVYQELVRIWFGKSMRRTIF